MYQHQSFLQRKRVTAASTSGTLTSAGSSKQNESVKKAESSEGSGEQDIQLLATTAGTCLGQLSPPEGEPVSPECSKLDTNLSPLHIHVKAMHFQTSKIRECPYYSKKFWKLDSVANIFKFVLEYSVG